MADGARPAGLSAPGKLAQAISVYRVARAAYSLFDGSGAARFGARWTSPGRAAIYAAGSYAGALLEILAHARRADIDAPYHCLVIRIPRMTMMQEVSASEVNGWEAADYVASRAVGDAWLDRRETAVLRVPSLTAWPHECNYVINPQHRDVQRLELGEAHLVRWDGRLKR